MDRSRHYATGISIEIIEHSNCVGTHPQPTRTCTLTFDDELREVPSGAPGAGSWKYQHELWSRDRGPGHRAHRSLLASVDTACGPLYLAADCESETEEASIAELVGDLHAESRRSRRGWPADDEPVTQKCQTVR